MREHEGHSNQAEIDAAMADLVDMLTRRKQHWLEIMEATQRQMDRAQGEVSSAEKQLLDLGVPAGQQLTLTDALLIHDAVLFDNREIVHYGGDQ